MLWNDILPMIKKYPETPVLTISEKPSTNVIQTLLAYSKMVEVKKGKQHKLLIRLN